MNPSIQQAANTEHRCVICQSPLGAVAALSGRNGDAICASADCRRISFSKASMAPQLFTQQVEQRRQQLSRQAEHRERVEKRRREHQAATLAAAQSDSRYRKNPGAFTTLSLPSGPRRTSALYGERVARYTEHLEKVIDEAFAQPVKTAGERAGEAGERPGGKQGKMAARISRFPEIAKLNARFCSLCQGACCIKGAESAYITADTIRRIRSDRPDIRPREVLDLYLSRLQAETVEGSCINHTDKGCGLAPQHRADTCNRFHCPALNDYAKNYARKPKAVSGALVINRLQNIWRSTHSYQGEVLTVAVVEPDRIKKIEF